ncbi:MAG: M20/M25/M40 family metallo-hydrolase [Gemmatimonadota bacterium]|nr:M20/M25/M40 family metallo-hydrolase [Gemmatimonadota bacterium]
MKRIAIVLGMVLLVLVAVVTLRTIRFVPSHSDTAAIAPLTSKNDSVLAEHLAGAVRIRTVSYQDSTPRRAALAELHAYLARTFPRTHATLGHEVVGDSNLLFTWAGTDTTLEPIVMMAHLDVVPVEPGSERAWTHPPFSGDIADGFIWGRGTMDDKVGVLSVLEAVEALVGEGVRPRRTVFLAFGADEEVAGRGATDIIAVLRSRGVHPIVAVDEGSAVVRGVIPGTSRPVGLIGIAEKGYASVELTVEGTGGHSSMPPPQTAVGVLAHAIDQLERHPMRPRLNDASAAMFDRVGRDLALPYRIVMANLWLTRPVLLRMLSRSPTTNATIRTTTAPTVIQGSPKDNVLPIRARAIVNFRIIPGETPENVLQHVRTTVHDPRVAIALTGTSSPPSPVSSTSSAPYLTLARTIRALEPDAIVSPSLVIAATDARHYAGYARNVYRFLPLPIGPEDLERIHGTNERVGVHDYGRAVAFMTKLIRDLSAQ